MISASTLFKKISYKEIVASLVEVMAANFEDFSADQARFSKTISFLENELQDATTPSVNEVVDAIDRQIGSSLLLSFFLVAKQT